MLCSHQPLCGIFYFIEPEKMISKIFIVLFVYLLIQGFEYWLKYLNLTHMKIYGMNVPSGFEGYIDEPVLKKTHAYTIEHNRLSLIESLFGNVLLLVFIYGWNTECIQFLDSIYEPALCSDRPGFFSPVELCKFDTFDAL